METIFIVNMDERAFFRYNKVNNTDKRYNKLLLELVTPPHKQTQFSHWKKTDKIVLAPNHTHNYLERTYNEIIIC